MNQQEKNELTTWSVVGLVAVALVIGVVYVNRNGNDLNDISPAAGTSLTRDTDADNTIETPAYTPTSPVENPAEPQPTYP